MAHKIKPEDFMAFVLIIILILVVFFVNGCASNSHRREALQAEHPECYVFEDLYIECPNPFVDTSAGFGIEIKNQKIKKPQRTKGKP